LESDLQIEKQRVTALDREYHIFKTQLAQSRSESEKIKAELSAANDKIASLETAPREELMPALKETSPAVEISSISSLASAEAPAVVEAPAVIEAPAVTKPQKNTLATEVLGKRVVQDDLKIVEGIGPKIEELLNADGISTWQQLGEASVERIQDILNRAGERFVMHNPTTWPRQGQLAHEAKWEELRAWQDQLDGGKLPE
jgi:predicted flap endonuclease-1-like 5' DNA nuclease